MKMGITDTYILSNHYRKIHFIKNNRRKNMKLWIQAISELCRNYCRIWKSIWPYRKDLEPIERNENEKAFLPAHLELTETPVSVAPKAVARAIILFTAIAFVWALIGQIDILAITQGKTIPSGRSKQIQPLETSVVKNIYVSDGQFVRKGQPLIELSGIGSDSDYEQSVKGLQAVQLAKLRAEALIVSIEKRQRLSLNRKLAEKWGIPSEDINETEILGENHYQTWVTQNEKLQTILNQYHAELRSNDDQIHKLERIGKIERQRSKDFLVLLNKNYLSQHEYYEQESKVIQNEHDLKSLRNKTQQIQESISQAEQEQRLNTTTLQRDTLETLRQANEQIHQLSGQLLKATQRQHWMSLSSPVDGTIQQLAVHTVGGVVTEAQPIMVIVPLEDKIEVETLIANKDIGFVNVGQPVTVKIESFPYTRYGYLTGKVISVSLDAMEHEQLGMVFSAIVALDQNHLMIEGKRINLVAGMNVTAEIKTSKRRVIDYLLSPLQTKVDESFKER